MALNTEFLITLQQLKGVGNKTILSIANPDNGEIKTLDELCELWKSLKGKRFENISINALKCAHLAAHKIIEDSKKEGLEIISYYESEFPSILKNCINEEGKDDPVIVLYCRGNLNALNKPGIAVIGTREPTPNGVRAGIHFSSEFAKRGFNIVSGLAIGCDTTGHKGALSVEGGTTTAFLANGLDWNSIYPKENIGLAKEIVAMDGLLLSEYPIGQTCGRYALVARDRLQAGLSYATIAIQTGIHGGTMHAVNTTIRAHKPLFMVKYKNFEDTNHEKVQGNIKLLREGKAFPLESANLDETLAKIRDSISKFNKPKQADSLF